MWTQNCELQSLLVRAFFFKKASLSVKTQQKANMNSWRWRTKTASIQTEIIILITAAMFNEGTILTARCVPNTSVRYCSSRAVTSLPQNNAVNEIMWKNVWYSETGASALHATVQSYWGTLRVSKITALPQQQWFDESASVWRSPYFACLVTFNSLVSLSLDHIYNNLYYYPHKIVLPTSGSRITKTTCKVLTCFPAVGYQVVPCFSLELPGKGHKRRDFGLVPCKPVSPSSSLLTCLTSGL